MTIDINTFATVCAFVGCAILLIIWLTLGKRTASNFYITCTGWAAIVACVRSDHSLTQMVGILILAAFISGALFIGLTLLKARRAAHRQQLMVYRPKVSKTHQN